MKISGLLIVAVSIAIFDGIFGNAINQPKNKEFRTEGDILFNPYPDWMSDLSNSLSLGEVTLPGTHDTMARFGGSLSECQRLTLPEQLNYGIRVLDIRCRHIENVCAIHHGPVFQNAFLGDVLTDSVQFLAAHPSEVIVMRLKEEHNPENNNRPLVETIEWYLNLEEYKEFIWRGGDRIPSLGEIRGKIVVLDQIGNNGQFGPGWYRCGGCGSGRLDQEIACTTPCIQDEWTVNTILPGDIDKKWGQIYNHFSKSNAGSPDHIYINFLSGSSAFAHPNAVADRINIRFVEHLREYILQYKNLGAVMMDFPLAEQLMQIIDVNFRDVNVAVEFFQHQYEEGESKIFSIPRNTCINFGHWNDRASSMNTFGKCVQIWEHGSCEGATRSVDSSQDDCAYSLARCGWNDHISSISQC